MTLTRRQYQLVCNAVRKCAPRVSYSAAWQALGRQLDLPLEQWLGMGNKLELDRERRALLCAGIKSLYGFDPLFDELDGDRLTLAGKTANEKLAPVLPEQSRVLVRTSGVALELPVEDGSLRLPINQALELIAKLQLIWVIVVENLDVFDIWQPALETLADGPGLLVFNGGQQQYSAKGVKAFLQECPVPAYAFGDLDPAGLAIAWHLPQIRGFISARDLANLPTIPHISHSVDYDAQHNQAQFIRTTDLRGWQPLAELVLAHRLSIKQQHLLAHRLPLTLYLL
ncbi:MAG: hypothetical protein LPH21_10435 [Shewanella sp.]|nr:hypothetical protein [Shewanella sp.]MCF1430419.1 hypothetical protein [Shewanella sp.]MCF1457945.1 hypothetical protein [Shewanella sp.]